MILEREKYKHFQIIYIAENLNAHEWMSLLREQPIYRGVWETGSEQ